MSVIELTQERRDEYLRGQYMRSVQALGITDPYTLARIECYLTPEVVAKCRDDMRAIVYGEPMPYRRT